MKLQNEGYEVTVCFRNFSIVSSLTARNSRVSSRTGGSAVKVVFENSVRAGCAAAGCRIQRVPATNHFLAHCKNTLQ